MIADCPGCAPAAADVPEPSRARARLPWLGLLPAVLYAVVPKCPFCLVAYLSAFGVTAGVASFFLSVLPPLAIVSAMLGLGFTLWRVRAKVLSSRGRTQCDSTERGSSSSVDGSASLVSGASSL